MPLAAPPGPLWTADAKEPHLFRALYDRVRVLEEREIDFSMSVREFGGDGRRTWLRSTLSRTLIGFHGGLAVMVCLAMMVA